MNASRSVLSPLAQVCEGRQDACGALPKATKSPDRFPTTALVCRESFPTPAFARSLPSYQPCTEWIGYRRANPQGKGESMGEVVSIHIVGQRHGAAEAVERVMAQTNYGLQGDWRSGRNRSGQLTLIEAEALDGVGQLLGAPVPSGASRRQVVVRGAKLNDFIGKRVRIGAVRVFVETPCDPCSRMEETISAGARKALEGRGGVRCFILAGGELRVGDCIVEDPFQEQVLEKAAVTGP
jgi:MOSC domain-containing protein YiiM